MARRSSSFGFMGRFGRSSDLRQLDAALREADLHPLLVPEGVKLAAVNLMKDALGEEPSAPAYPPVGALMAYCVHGPSPFAAVNGEGATLAVEERIARAVEAGEGLDAELILLMVHAKLLNPGVRETFGIEVAEE